MSRTAIAVTQINRTGVASVASVAADVANGNQITNAPHMWFEVFNTDTAIHNISVQPTRQVDGSLPGAKSTPIPASTTLPIKFGPYSINDYGTTVLVNGDNVMLKIAAYSM